MPKEMLINVSEGEECRIALIEDGRLEELYMERTSATSHVGNIYKGKVTNVEASIQAAFVDFGLGRNGFLHISDLMPTYFGRNGNDFQEQVGRKLSRRDRPPIQRCLRRGDEIIVQIIKEGIGTKGPTLSTYVSIPGRILVMMPGMSKFGVSRKIEDEDERRRLRGILDSLKPIDDVGFIIRTAGIGKTKTEIQRDLTYLTRLWQNIDKKRREPSPVELYTEGDLVTRTVRDVFSTDLDRIVVDNEDVAQRIKEFFKIAMPRTKNRVELYEGPVPLFHQAGIEREIELMYSRHVPLPSGGSLVIDSTEAVVAIDVNSGKFREHNDAEMTAFKTDMEAADEIPRQLKLRDLGGVIICDFIDLRFERNRRELEKKLHDNFRNDRAKTKVLRMSQFGIIELTRQRMRPSLKRSIYFDCPNCKGTGLVKTPESMSLDVMRRLAIAAHDLKVARIELTVCPDVGVYVLNKKRAQLTKLEDDTRKRIIVRQDATLGLDHAKIELFDSRDGNVFLEELGMTPGGDAEEPRRRHQQPTTGRRDGRGGRPQGRQQPPTRRDEEDDDVDELDSAEDAVEDREETRADEHAASDLAAPLPAGPPRVPPRLPIGRVEGVSIEIGGADDESSVIEVDEPNEPIGEGPEEYVDDRDSRNRHRDHGGPRRDDRNRGRDENRGRNDNRGRDDRGRDDRARDDRNRNQSPARRDDRGRPDNRRDQQPQNRAPAGQPQRRADNRGPQNAPAYNNGGRPQGNQNIGNDAGGQNPGDESGEGGRKRRRRRRGRRGRGREGQTFDAQGQPINTPASGEPHPFERAYNEQPGENLDDDDLAEHGTEDGSDELNAADAPAGPSMVSEHGDEHGDEHGHDLDEVNGNVAESTTDQDREDAEEAAAEKAEAGVSDEGGSATDNADEDDDQPRRRRRRRGGRRHRARRERAESGTAGSEGPDPVQAAADDDDEIGEAPQPIDPEPVVEAPVEEEPVEEAPVKEASEEKSPAEKTPVEKTPVEKGPAKPKRRRAPAKAAGTTTRRKSTRKAPTAVPPAEPPTAVAPTIVRTGSADKHLADDVPVDMEPVHRPRSYRDLDELPDMDD